MSQNQTGRSRPRLTAAGCGVAALLLALTACGAAGSADEGSGSSSRTISVDGIDVQVSGTPRIAFFAPFLGNAAIQLVKKTVEKRVEDTAGAEITVFDANGNATTQANQIQNAVQSKKFNVAFVIAADPVLECKAITQDMPRAGMLVGVFNTPMCETWKNEGDGLRAPGTFAFIGGTHTIDYYTDYFSYIAEQNPGPQQVLVITAPQLNAIAQAIDLALKNVTAKYPDFKVVDEAYTDYSVPASFKETQTMIQAHPKATILYTGYSTSAQGAVQALQAAGKEGQVKIYDKGGSQWAADAVRKGQVEATTPEAQVTSARALIDLLLDGLSGRTTTPTVILHDGIDLLPSATKTGFEVFTKENIDLWKPEVP
ncbi:MAG: sugar ABC transporter substrate-binding protein [Nocardioidaceae bacterium]|nr:sugar ABC transporter substrate-binding protein [Nocardioidaceae bacterium]